MVDEGGRGVRHAISGYMGQSLVIPKPYSPPEVDRIWLWVYHNGTPIYTIFYLLKGDYTLNRKPLT